MTSDLDTRTARALAAFSAIVGEPKRLTPLLTPVIMPMHLAIDSHSYRIDAATGSFFLKLHAEDLLFSIDRPASLLASRRAGDMGLGPALLADDDETGAMLFQWMGAPDWRMATRLDLADKAILDAILSAKKHWHDGAPILGNASPFARLREFQQLLAESESAMPAPAALPQLLSWAERIEAAITAAGTDAVPLHGESFASNVMIGADRAIRLVDFDQAGQGDRLYDLAAFSLEFCSFDDEVEALVGRYLGHHDPSAIARTHLYRMVDDLVWGCWALVAQARSPRRNKIEFYKYAQNRLLRCQYWLGIREFDNLLQQV